MFLLMEIWIEIGQSVIRAWGGRWGLKETEDGETLKMIDERLDKNL